MQKDDLCNSKSCTNTSSYTARLIMFVCIFSKWQIHRLIWSFYVTEYQLRESVYLLKHAITLTVMCFHLILKLLWNAAQWLSKLSASIRYMISYAGSLGALLCLPELLQVITSAVSTSCKQFYFPTPFQHMRDGDSKHYVVIRSCTDF